MSHPSQTLSEQIEQLVREHIESTRRTAVAAVERALYSSSAPATRSTASRAARRPPGRRRTPDELVALSERLYAAVVSEPGETMAVLSPALGATAEALSRPMAALKRDGRVRSVGQRHQTRYYPTAAGR